VVRVIEERLAELGIELPPAPAPVASYVPVAVAGDLAFVAGQVPVEDGQVMLTGRLGDEVGIERGRRQPSLRAPGRLGAADALGSLDRVAQIPQVTVYVASVPGFIDQPKVANGASDVLVEIFGEAGKHARAAVGVVELPLGAPVEVAVTARIT
jgi:enamine deaminase RidA (YjgF/YER057c/UK114 family)